MPDVTTLSPRTAALLDPDETVRALAYKASLSIPPEVMPEPVTGAPNLSEGALTEGSPAKEITAEEPTAELLPTSLTELNYVNGRPVWRGKPIVYVRDELLTMIPQATADLAPMGVYASIDSQLVSVASKEPRLVYIKKPILFALMEAATLFLADAPMPPQTSSVETASDGKTTETRKTVEVLNGARVIKTTKTHDGKVVKESSRHIAGQDSPVQKEEPPQRLVDAIHERGEYPELPELHGVRAYPYGKDGGGLVLRAGYDSDSKYIFRPARPFSMPTDLSQEAAKRAAAELLDLYGDVPLSAAGRAALLAMHFSAVMRPALDFAPFFALDAPTPGSGKGLVVTCVSLASSGDMPIMVPYRRNPEEQEKTFASALKECGVVTNFDNASAPVGGGTFDSVITAPNGETRLRLLGSSTMERVSTKTTIVVTGNNVRFLGDTNRRALVIRIDPNVERPEERTGFKHADLKEHFRTNVHEINKLVLIPLEAFRLAGRPQADVTPWGFPKWDHFVRSLVIWLGYSDPCQCRVTSVERDPDTSFLATVLPVIEAFNKTGKGAKSSDIVAKLGDAQALERFKGPTGTANVQRFGIAMDGFVGRVVGGLKLKPRSSSGGASVWRVARVDHPPDDVN